MYNLEAGSVEWAPAEGERDHRAAVEELFFVNRGALMRFAIRRLGNHEDAWAAARRATRPALLRLIYPDYGSHRHGRSRQRERILFNCDDDSVGDGYGEEDHEPKCGKQPATGRGRGCRTFGGREDALTGRDENLIPIAW